MKYYKISEEQINKIGAILLEIPAKQVLPAIDLFRSLQFLGEEGEIVQQVTENVEQKDGN